MIVIFSHAHPSVSKGGAEVSAHTLFKGLLEAGQEACFVAMCPVDDLPRVRCEMPNEFLLPYQPHSYDYFFHFADPALFSNLQEILTPLNPSSFVFHHFLFLGINTVRQLVEHFQVPSVLVLHEFLAICQHHGQMVTRPDKKLCESASPSRCSACYPEHSPEEFHIRTLYVRQTLQLMHRLVSPSRFLADRFAAWGVPRSQFAIIENGLRNFDPTQSQPARREVLRSGPLDEGTTVFGYFGQINPFKGVDLLLDAVELLGAEPGVNKLLRIRLHGNLVGVSDDFRQRLKAALGSEGLVDNVGVYDNDDVMQLMGACDYILMASTWWENSPVVIQEAFAAGRPVIAPRLGGMAEKVIDGVNGWHFRPNDAADLARLLLERSRAGDDSPPLQLPRPLTALEMARQYLTVLAPA